MEPSAPVLYQAFAEGLADLPAALETVPKLAREQTDTRRAIIAVLNRLGDALEGAGDQVNVALSEQILGFQEVSSSAAAEIQAFLRKCSRQLRGNAIGERLKKGHVCHELHALYDEYGHFAAGASVSGQGASDWLRTLFGKSTKMRDALGRLMGGEQEYLRDMTRFLQDVADEAEMIAGSRLEKDELLKQCECLVEKLRKKRVVIRASSNQLQEQVDATIKLLVGDSKKGAPNPGLAADS